MPRDDNDYGYDYYRANYDDEGRPRYNQSEGPFDVSAYQRMQTDPTYRQQLQSQGVNLRQENGSWVIGPSGFAGFYRRGGDERRPATFNQAAQNIENAAKAKQTAGMYNQFLNYQGTIDPTTAFELAGEVPGAPEITREWVQEKTADAKARGLIPPNSWATAKQLLQWYEPPQGESTKYYTYGGLPVRQGPDGAWYYDAGLMAQAMGYDEATANKLYDDRLYANYDRRDLARISGNKAADFINNPGLYDSALLQARGTSDMEIFGGKHGAFMDKEQGLLLRNLARTPVVLGTPLDLSDARHLDNAHRGFLTVDNVGRHGAWSPEAYHKQAFYKPDEEKWYDPGNLVKMAVLGGMGLMAGGAFGPALFGAAGAPVWGSTVGGGALGLGGFAPGSLTSSLAIGAGAGFGSSLPGALHTGMTTKDWGAAAKQIGMGTAMGGAAGGISHGVGNLVSGEIEPSGYIDMPTMGEGNPMFDPNALDAALQNPTLNLPDYAGGIEAIGDMYGGLDTGLYGLEMPTMGEGTIFDPAQNDIFNQDKIYGIEGTRVMPEVDAMADRLEAMGEHPSIEPVGKFPWHKALGLINPWETPPSGPTDYVNDDFTPIFTYGTSGAQAAGAGIGYDGMTTPIEMSQQYQAVRPVMENYTQDLVSMVEANPELLNDPSIYNMMAGQLEGGGFNPKRWGGFDPEMSYENLTAGADLIV